FAAFVVLVSPDDLRVAGKMGVTPFADDALSECRGGSLRSSVFAQAQLRNARLASCSRARELDADASVSGIAGSCLRFAGSHAKRTGARHVAAPVDDSDEEVESRSLSRHEGRIIGARRNRLDLD